MCLHRNSTAPRRWANHFFFAPIKAERIGSGMDADALEAFLAVYRHRSFSKAAQMLHRTQPALSRRIRLLEEELGAPVFTRGAGQIALTQAGEVLLPYAARGLAVLKDAVSAVRALRSEKTGPVALAVVGTLAGPPLTAILKSFLRKYPEVRLTLGTARSTEVSELVRSGEANIGLRYELDRAADLACDELGSETLEVVCAREHPLAGRTISSLKRLRDERWLAFPTIDGQREAAASHVFGIFLAHGLGELEWTPVDSLTAQKRLVEAGMGLALMTPCSFNEELAAGTLATIRVRDLRAALPVFLVTRRDGFLSAAAIYLCQLLREEFGRPPRRSGISA
jgi:DNA-binding transcriptional LysR family regulator